MAKRLVAIYDVGVPKAQRPRLPSLLCEGLKNIPGEVQALGFSLDRLEPSRCIWDLVSDPGSDSEASPEAEIVGLSWPDSLGIGLKCGTQASYIFTGIRWDAFVHTPEVTRAAKALIEAVGRSLGAHKALLLPDSGDPAADQAQDLFFEGAPFHRLAAHISNEPSARYVDI